jgi:hypothetical protein
MKERINMKERIKWLCVGVGVMYGTQLIILLIIHNLIPASAPPEFSNLLATVVYTLIAFMAGGFVIGLMAERVDITESAIATGLTLGIDTVTSLTGGLSGMFLFSFAVGQGSYGTALTIAAVAVVAAVAGSLAGERLAVPSESWVSQGLMIVGLAGLTLGPFLLLASFVSRTVSVVTGVLLLGSVWAISHHFHQQDREEEEMSIRPEASRN